MKFWQEQLIPSVLWILYVQNLELVLRFQIQDLLRLFITNTFEKIVWL